MIHRLLSLLASSPLSCAPERSRPAPQEEGEEPIPVVAPPAGAAPKAPEPQRSEYVPPQKFSRPQASAIGVVHHPLVVDGEPIRDSYPFDFSCNENTGRCSTGLGTKLYSFAISDVESGENGRAIPSQVEDDFSQQIDPQTMQMSAVARYGNFTYALFDRFAGGAMANAGIAIHNGVDPLQTFFFPSVNGRSVSCPKNLFFYHNPSINYKALWVSLSNCDGPNDFLPGTLFPLQFGLNGTLEPTMANPLQPSQFNPQVIAGWNTEDKPYLLVVNTGKTKYPLPGGQAMEVTTEGGVDVIDPEEQRIVGNIPLGLSAANSITISKDNTLAFLGSQVLPKLYALDLVVLARHLRENPAGPQSWSDVVIANADNAIPMDENGKAFFPEIEYDDVSKTVAVSSFNDGRLYQVLARHVSHDNVGIEFEPGFGSVMGHYLCAGDKAEYCGEMEWIASGLVALTGHPASITFLPNSVLGRKVPGQ